VAACIIGCGPGTSGAKGTAKLKDGTALPGGTVVLFSVGGGSSAYADIQSDGTFVLGTLDVDDGAIPGEYKVVVTATTSGEHDESGGGGESKSLVHTKYNSVETTDLSVEIVSGENTLNLELEPFEG
jgi:hypothetical protein